MFLHSPKQSAMNFKNFFLTTFFFVSAFVVHAQKRTITGIVTDASTNLPLQGVSITVIPGETGAISGAGGVFSVQASNTDRIEFTNIGYSVVSISVKGQTTLNIKMETSTTDLGQIVLVGTRTGGRIKTESPVPVDVININQAGAPTARMDLTSF